MSPSTRNDARAERGRAVSKAILDEMERFNTALRLGQVAILQTAFGPYQVAYVHPMDFTVACHPVGTVFGHMNRRTFHIGNDERWASLMKQAALERHPILAENPLPGASA